MERIYRIVPNGARSTGPSLLPVPVQPAPVAAPERDEIGDFLCGIAVLSLLGLGLIGFGFATGALYTVSAAELAAMEAAPGVLGAMGVKIVPEVAAAAAVSAL